MAAARYLRTRLSPERGIPCRTGTFLGWSMADLVTDAVVLAGIAGRTLPAVDAVAWSFPPLDFETLGDGEVTQVVSALGVGQRASCVAVADAATAAGEYPHRAAAAFAETDERLARGVQ